LAVGDAEFQKKCLNKMEDVGKTGRTVLFVSHNMPAVTRLCDRSIWIEGGKLIADGPSDEIVKNYLCSDLGTSAAREWNDKHGSRLGQGQAARGQGSVRERPDHRFHRHPQTVPA
jgi:ABC-type multidrug transport system ATPase subunit